MRRAAIIPLDLPGGGALAVPSLYEGLVGFEVSGNIFSVASGCSFALRMRMKIQTAKIATITHHNADAIVIMKIFRLRNLVSHPLLGSLLQWS